MKERESNIEILRCLAIVFVLILHYNAESVGGGFQYVSKGTLNYYLLYFLEALSICAVDIFIVISGYFYYGRYSRKLGKPIMLLLTCIGYKFLLYGLSVITYNQPLSYRGILDSLIPNNYFIILYISIYFVSLYINIILAKISKKEYKIMLLIFTCVFVLWENIWDLVSEILSSNIVGISFVGAWGNQAGYTIINFSLLYLYGAYIRKYGLLSYKKRSFYFIGFCIMSCIIFLGSLKFNVFWNYNNVFVIIQAICLFMFF